MTELIDWTEYGRPDAVGRMKTRWRWQFSAMRGHRPVIFRGAGDNQECHGIDSGKDQRDFDIRGI